MTREKPGKTDRRSRLTLGVFLLIAVSCRVEKDGANASGDSSHTASGIRSAAPNGAPYSVKDFANLRWIQGDWGGDMPDGRHFYERYNFVDDSTIVMHGYTDPLLEHPSDSATIVLRDGKIVDRGASAEWNATSLDSGGIEFAPLRGATNHFSWIRESRQPPSAWTATLRSAKGKTTVYRMRRVTTVH